MKQSYIFEYQNENDFRKKERSVRKYNMLAYKKLTFDYYPKIRNGEFLGELIHKDKNTKSYELILPTDEMFVKVHGEVKLHYRVNSGTNTITLLTLSPEEILREGHKSELVAYKGVMVSKEHEDADKFKINLLNMINKN
jgi:hypothetical protein